MVVEVQPTLPIPGIPDPNLVQRFASRGLAGVGGLNWPEDYMWSLDGLGEGSPSLWSWLQDTTRGTLDIIKARLTPPAYESRGPGGTTIIRTPTAPPVPPTYRPPEQPFPGMSTNTLIAVGIAAAVGIAIVMRR